VYREKQREHKKERERRSRLTRTLVVPSVVLLVGLSSVYFPKLLLYAEYCRYLLHVLLEIDQHSKTLLMCD